jgi:aromatic ring hydroxylase
MSKVTPKFKNAEEYINPNLVVRIEPERNKAGVVIGGAEATCTVHLLGAASFEMLGTVDQVITALKVP